MMKNIKNDTIALLTKIKIDIEISLNRYTNTEI